MQSILLSVLAFFLLSSAASAGAPTKAGSVIDRRAHPVDEIEIEVFGVVEKRDGLSEFARTYRTAIRYVDPSDKGRGEFTITGIPEELETRNCTVHVFRNGSEQTGWDILKIHEDLEDCLGLVVVEPPRFRVTITSDDTHVDEIRENARETSHSIFPLLVLRHEDKSWTQGWLPYPTDVKDTATGVSYSLKDTEVIVFTESEAKGFELSFRALPHWWFEEDFSVEEMLNLSGRQLAVDARYPEDFELRVPQPSKSPFVF